MCENRTATSVDVQLLDSTRRQSLESWIMGPEQKRGVRSLDNAKIVVKDMRRADELISSTK